MVIVALLNDNHTVTPTCTLNKFARATMEDCVHDLADLLRMQPSEIEALIDIRLDTDGMYKPVDHLGVDCWLLESLTVDKALWEVKTMVKIGYTHVALSQLEFLGCVPEFFAARHLNIVLYKAQAVRAMTEEEIRG